LPNSPFSFLRVVSPGSLWLSVAENSTLVCTGPSSVASPALSAKLSSRAQRGIYFFLCDICIPDSVLSALSLCLFFCLLTFDRRSRPCRDCFCPGRPKSPFAARNAVRRLVDHGALRLVDRTEAGHVVEVRLPHEIRAARPGPAAPRRQSRGDGFRETKALRRPSTRASVASAFTVCATLPPSCAPSTLSCPASSWGAIPTATSSPAVWNATRKRGTAPPRISSAGSTASAA